MATRIAHISDLHFPAKSAEQVNALRKSIASLDPDLAVVTGDLTRSGKREEFRQAKNFIKSLGVQTLVLPGNHDVPVPGIWARLVSPFARFRSYFPDMPTYVETPDVVIVRLNTAVGLQLGLDWSLGVIVRKRLDRAIAALSNRREGRLGIVACHHPMHQNPLDAVRSRTSGGERAFAQLSSAGMDILLHGHLHRTAQRCFPTTSLKQVCEICANTALSNRERAGPAGYNFLDVQGGQWRLIVVEWDGECYNPALPTPWYRDGNRTESAAG